jgi:hypothetical protein
MTSVSWNTLSGGLEDGIDGQAIVRLRKGRNVKGGKWGMTDEAPHTRPVAAADLPEPWRSMAVTVVVPTYNEAANLPVLAEALFDLPLSGLRVLVADDNSPDGTGKVAEPSCPPAPISSSGPGTSPGPASPRNGAGTGEPCPTGRTSMSRCCCACRSGT